MPNLRCGRKLCTKTAVVVVVLLLPTLYIQYFADDSSSTTEYVHWVSDNYFSTTTILMENTFV